MNFYISDLHLGHANVMSYDNRPFGSLEDMHSTIIKNWNSAVTSKDTVFILGDFAWKDAIGASIAKQLNGQKILVEGNHDNRVGTSLKKYFQAILPYHEVTDNNMKVVLSHYPIAHWNRQHYGAILLYGHVHNSKEDDFFQEYVRNFGLYCCKPMHAYNVGCMQSYMNYTPRTLQEIIQSR